MAIGTRLKDEAERKQTNADFLAKVMEDEAKKIDSRYKAEQQKKGAQNNTNKNKDNAKGKTITNTTKRRSSDVKKSKKKEEVKKREVRIQEPKKEEAKAKPKSEADRLREQYYQSNPIPNHTIGIFYNRSEAVRGPGTPTDLPGDCYAKAVPMKRNVKKSYYTDF